MTTGQDAPARILVIGAAGMVGRKLTARLARDGRIGTRPLAALHLVDVAEPAPVAAGVPVVTGAVDIADPAAAPRLVADRPDVIFHLAAIVSGEAEQDFDKGYAINMDGMRFLLDAIRAEGAARGPYLPRLVFTSSIAVFGAPLPPAITDDFLQAPRTSYGTQKAICDLLLADYTRKGFVDGIGIRLPTVSVRPGRPNAAASGFFSNIIREPLAGEEAVLPVGEAVRHWHASPRSTVGFLLHAAGLDGTAVGPRRTLNMPGVSVTVGEQIEALRRVGGDKAVALIRREPDPFIQGIVANWAENFDAARALALGFTAEPDFDSIVRVHVEDELGGRVG